MIFRAWNTSSLHVAQIGTRSVQCDSNYQNFCILLLFQNVIAAKGLSKHELYVDGHGIAGKH